MIQRPTVQYSRPVIVCNITAFTRTSRIRALVSPGGWIDIAPVLFLRCSASDVRFRLVPSNPGHRMSMPENHSSASSSTFLVLDCEDHSLCGRGSARVGRVLLPLDEAPIAESHGRSVGPPRPWRWCKHHRAQGYPTILQAMTEHVRSMSERNQVARLGEWRVMQLEGDLYEIRVQLRDQGMTGQWFEREFIWHADLALKKVNAASLPADGITPKEPDVAP